MISIPKKQAGGLKLPVIGLGTWQMGGTQKRDPQNDDKRDIQGIKEAIKMGISHIDTAEQYAQGAAEEFVGEAIKDFDRSKLFITTKVHLENLKYDDVIRSAKASMKRMRIDYIDLYLIHKPSTEIPVSETLRAMAYLMESELVKFIGVSNFHVPLLEEALSCTKYPIVNNQIHYNLSARAYEENGTLEFCRKNNILVTAYRPVGKGEFTKKGNPLLDNLAAKYNKTPAQIAINWVIYKPNIVTLVKTSNPEHLRENLAVLGWNLDKEDKKLLDEKYPRGETLFQT